MTVSELIEQLQKENPKAELYILGNNLVVRGCEGELCDKSIEIGIQYVLCR